MRVINVGKAALNRAVKRHELESVPHILAVPIGESAPKGRPLSVEELQAIYGHAAPHLRVFMEYAIGTAARPEAVLELHSNQINRVDGLIDLLPEGRQQISKKYRPVVRPDALRTSSEGTIVAYGGRPLKKHQNRAH
jgi:hypothetical protein